MKKYKTINVEIETFEELHKLCSTIGVKKSNFIRGLLQFIKSNQSLITADFFQKSDKEKSESFFSMNEKLEKMISKEMKKEANRIISFLKVQDKFMMDMKMDFYHKLDKNNLGEYHPLFRHTDLVLQDIEDYLNSKGENLDNVYRFLKENVSKDKAENFLRSLKNVQQKTLKY